MQYHKIDMSNHPTILQFVDLIYEISNDEDGFIYNTIPNCTIGISIVLDGHAEIMLEGKWIQIPNFTIYGLLEKSQKIRMSSSFREIAFGFKPYNLKHLIPYNIAEFSKGKTENMDNVFNKYVLEKLKYDINCSANDHELVSILEEFIIKHIVDYSYKGRAEFAYNSILNGDIYSVQHLAENLNLSTTSVRNLFKEAIGISPKELMKSSRLEKVMSHNISFKSELTQLGLEYGYYDQAHFIKDFRSILGMTPKEYFKNDQLTFDFYNYGRWTDSRL